MKLNERLTLLPATSLAGEGGCTGDAHVDGGDGGPIGLGEQHAKGLGLGRWLARVTPADRDVVVEPEQHPAGRGPAPIDLLAQAAVTRRPGRTGVPATSGRAVAPRAGPSTRPSWSTRTAFEPDPMVATGVRSTRRIVTVPGHARVTVTRSTQGACCFSAGRSARS